MALQKPAIALIDLDGTLVDSVPDLAWCTDEMMNTLGMPAQGEEKVRNWVGNGLERLIKRALSEVLDGEPDNALYTEATALFKKLYADNPSNLSQLYPFVKEGLHWLQENNVRLGCVTNKDEQFTLPILQNLGIVNFFEIVISGDTLPYKKPHPAPLLHGAEFFGVSPDNAIMIGDSMTDVKASRAAGFDIICLSYGYNHGVDIRTAEPDAVIDTFAELESLF